MNLYKKALPMIRYYFHAYGIDKIKKAIEIKMFLQQLRRFIIFK